SWATFWRSAPVAWCGLTVNPGTSAPVKMTAAANACARPGVQGALEDVLLELLPHPAAPAATIIARALARARLTADRLTARHGISTRQCRLAPLEGVSLFRQASGSGRCAASAEECQQRQHGDQEQQRVDRDATSDGKDQQDYGECKKHTSYPS